MGRSHKLKNNKADISLTPERGNGSTINWYPGHMAKALRQVKEKMKGVDIILEVRDARVPITSGNAALDVPQRRGMSEGDTGTGSSESPIKAASTAAAHALPSAIAQTMSD